MPKYMLIRCQMKEGCDYTIGCGIAITILDAPSITYLITAEEHNWSVDPKDEYCLGNVYIVPMEHVYDVNLLQLEERRMLEAARRKELAVENQERAELARLKTKYEATT